MEKSTFLISKMDCPSEENLIRIKLDELSGIKHLDFDIQNRKLSVIHDGILSLVEESLDSLSLDSQLQKNEQINHYEVQKAANQRNVLWIVLIINLSFFVIEMGSGLMSSSMGLIADSLDMLADSFVYGISLMAVGGSLVRKKQIARLAGYFQMILALIGFSEVIRRFFFFEGFPEFTTMITVSFLALMGNAACLFLLNKSKGKVEAHMKATIIFTSNDIIINLGVIFAGILVNWLGSGLPDLLIGSIVFLIVIRGAFRILKLGS